jgi:hypothetical protein
MYASVPQKHKKWRPYNNTISLSIVLLKYIYAQNHTAREVSYRPALTLASMVTPYADALEHDSVSVTCLSLEYKNKTIEIFDRFVCFLIGLTFISFLEHFEHTHTHIKPVYTG